jgi:hypothetical protein
MTRLGEPFMLLTLKLVNLTAMLAASSCATRPEQREYR